MEQFVENFCNMLRKASVSVFLRVTLNQEELLFSWLCSEADISDNAVFRVDGL